MKMKNTLNILRYIASGVGGIASLSYIPFVSEAWSVPIIGFSVASKPLFEKIGDYLDNKKFDSSFTLKSK